MASSPRDFVAAFHAIFGLPVAQTPTTQVPEDVRRVRIALLEEEVEEFRAAAHADDLVAMADALADLVYVAYGTALTYGIDLDAVVEEVHRSNLTKLGADGEPVRRSDGKILKSDGFSSPRIAEVMGYRPPCEPMQPKPTSRDRK